MFIPHVITDFPFSHLVSFNVLNGLVIIRSPSNISGAAAVVHPCDAAGWLAGSPSTSCTFKYLKIRPILYVFNHWFVCCIYEDVHVCTFVILLHNVRIICFLLSRFNVDRRSVSLSLPPPPRRPIYRSSELSYGRNTVGENVCG